MNAEERRSIGFAYRARPRNRVKSALPTAPPLLRYRQSVDLNFEEMVDADAVDAVDLRQRSALRLRMHHYAVDHEIDLVGADPHFEGIDGFSVGLRFLYRVVGRLWRYGSGCFAVAALDQPRTVLRHYKVQIALLRAFDTAAISRSEEHTSELQSP